MHNVTIPILFTIRTTTEEVAGKEIRNSITESIRESNFQLAIADQESILLFGMEYHHVFID